MLALSVATVLLDQRPAYAVTCTPDGGGHFFDGWGQAGYLRWENPTGGTELVHFAQFANDHDHNGYAGIPTTELRTFRYGAPATGDRPAYRVLWSAGCACLEASVNGYVFGRSDFNPFAEQWNMPLVPTFMGEMKYQTGNMPGTASVPTTFSAAGAQRYSDDVVVPMSCSMLAKNQNPTLWGLSAASCTTFSIWQK